VSVTVFSAPLLMTPSLTEVPGAIAPKAGAEGQPLQGLLVGHTRATDFDG
jgi:hypothetical protein